MEKRTIDKVKSETMCCSLMDGNRISTLVKGSRSAVHFGTVLTNKENVGATREANPKRQN